MEKDNNFRWIKKHADTTIVLAAILSSVLWMNGKFNDLERDVTVIKTVLIMKNIMPSELCKKEEKVKQVTEK